jgi:RNA polymerase sigma factor (TIGR02999 family)
MPASPPLTQLLDAAARGDRVAFDRAFAFLYDELRALAHAQRRRWQGNETLDTRVLVHEAYLKLLRPRTSQDNESNPAADEAEAAVDGSQRWQGRQHFFALAARAMRHVLVNYAEQQRAAKRGGDADRVGLEALDAVPIAPGHEAPGTASRGEPSVEEAEDILRIHEALADLEARSPRQARIIECRFFAGFSIPETAEALGISAATVKREWQTARTWLHAQLAGLQHE